MPYLIGRLYFSDAEGLRELAIAIVIGGLACVLPCLYEMRMSPLLLPQVYGIDRYEGIRMGGYRPRIFFSTGNGVFDPGAANFGDSVLRLSAAPALALMDYFTPSDQDDRYRGDRDLGSGGVLLLPDQPAPAPKPHLIVASGKKGTIYLLDRDNPIPVDIRPGEHLDLRQFVACRLWRFSQLFDLCRYLE